MSQAYIIHSTTLGTSSARPVTRYGTASSTDQALVQEVEADEALVMVDALLESMERAVYDTGADNLYNAPPPTAVPPDEQSNIIEERANFVRTCLRESEWTQLPDAPLTVAEVAEWTQYRADLRAYAAMPYNQGTSPAKPTTTEF